MNKTPEFQRALLKLFEPALLLFGAHRPAVSAAARALGGLTVACAISDTALAESWSEVCGVGSPDLRYIALGRTVLALPPDWRPSENPYHLESRASEELPPPDPSRPRGCWANPAQLKRYPLTDLPSKFLSLESKEAGDSSRIILMDFFLYWENSEHSKYRIDDREVETHNLQLQEKTCRHAKYNDNTDARFTLCYGDLGGNEIYLWNMDIYKTTLGFQFFFLCDSKTSSKRASCEVRYGYSGPFGLHYRFVANENPEPPTSVDVADQAIKLDSIIRRTIQLLIVPAYKWPDTAGTNYQSGDKNHE